MSNEKVVSLDEKRSKKKKADQADQPTPEAIAWAQARTNDQVRSDGSLLYKWTGVYWQAQDHQVAESAMMRWLTEMHPKKATPRVAASCVQAAIMGAQKLRARKNHDSLVLPLSNGYLHINAQTGSMDLKEPDPEEGLTYALDAPFAQGAKAERFARFLGEVLADKETRDYVQEYVGYTLLPDCRFQKAMFWLGSGANGKSTLAEISSRLHRQVSSIALDRLEGFRLTPLIGASLVIVDETPSRICEQEFKKIVSGGLIEINRKHRDPISFRPTAKWLILGNQPPAVSDQTHGFWRRLPTVRFERQFSEVEQDPHLVQKIVSTEMSGVLSWALVGLLRLLKRGHFPPPSEAMRAAAVQGMIESNSVLAWWTDGRAEVNQATETPRAEVYADYRTWATDNGMSPVSAERFWPRLELACGQKITPIMRKRNGVSERFVSIRMLRTGQ